MKPMILVALLIPMAASAADVRVTGAAAREAYDSLNIKPVNVIEEHTGMQYGIAKYGKTFGCERNLDNDSTYCWFSNKDHAYNGLIHGAVALEFYGALAITEVPVIEEHSGIELAKAKYGKNLGCQLNNENNVECWFK